MRSKSDKKKPLVPRLRFPEFREVGAWEVKRLGEVANISMGASPKSASYNDQRIGLPLIQGNADIKDRKSSPRLFASQITRECWVGDILVGVRAPVGMVAKSEHHACIGRGISALCVKGEDRQEFLYQWLLWYEPHWVSISQGGTFDSVNKNEITNLVALFPNPSEQQKVAHCLSSLDEVIGLQAKKVQALKQHKKGLMQQLFPAEGETTPRLRFPDFREAGAWEFIPLEAIAPLVNDRVQLKDISNVNYVSTENILQDFGGVAVANKLPTVNSVSSFQAGDVLLANIRPYLKKVWAANFSGGASNDVLVFRPRNSQGGQYVAHILKNNRFINYVMAGAKGVKMPRGDINSIKEYPVPIPPETTEQQKIAHCLSSLDEVIGLESHKLDALKNLKKGLMQQLFPQDVA